MKIFFDCNAFDYFYNRNLSPYYELINEGFTLWVTPSVREEIVEKNKPQEIKEIYLNLERLGLIRLHRVFGFVSYQQIQQNDIPRDVIGFTDYESFNSTHGRCLTYETMLVDGSGQKEKRDMAGNIIRQETKGEAFLNKRAKKQKRNNDRILSIYTVQSIVLTCDKGDALNRAYDIGYNVVFLGGANPQQSAPVNRPSFDDYQGTIIEYIFDRLEDQRKKKA